MAEVSAVPDEPGQPPPLTAPRLAQSAVKEQVVTPFDVSGGVDASGKAIAIDYDKLIETFGSRRIDEKLLERFEQVTGHKPHRLMRRGIVMSHRDLTLILDKHEKGLPFFLYTGRGPSSDSLTIGHSIPFEFTKWVCPWTGAFPGGCQRHADDLLVLDIYKMSSTFPWLS
jgi:tryptophanyl-tRNA synthetase